MAQENKSQESRDSLEARILQLEEQTRFTLDVLEMAAMLGDFQPSINQLHEPRRILEITEERVRGLIRFLGAGFYLVNEGTSDFELTMCRPERYRKAFDLEVADLIENGIFPLAIRENRPITVYSRDKSRRLVLHVLATSSRTRGMFVGLLDRKDKSISGILLSLLSIVLKNCANAIESFELYRLLREKERRYLALTDSLPQTVFEAEPDGRVLFISAYVERQFGYAPQEFAGALGFLDLVADGDRARVEAAFRQCVDAQQSCSLELVAVRRGGESFNGTVYLAPLLESGRCSGVRGLLAEAPPGGAILR